MPNWVKNRLKINGGNCKEVIHAITTFDQDEGKVVLDFNKIVPMPESIKKMESSSEVPKYIEVFINSIKKTDEFAKYLSAIVLNKGTYIDLKDEEYKLKLFKLSKETDFFGNPRFKDEQEVLDYGRMALDNILNYGVVDWYEWSIQNWGTKWNASETKIEDNVIWFDTAWSPVPELMNKISEMFPESIIEYDFSEEQVCVLCGEFEFEKGNCVREIVYDEFSKEAFEKGFEFWPDSKRYFKFNSKTKTYERKEQEEDM